MKRKQLPPKPLQRNSYWLEFLPFNFMETLSSSQRLVKSYGFVADWICPPPFFVQPMLLVVLILSMCGFSFGSTESSRQNFAFQICPRIANLGFVSGFDCIQSRKFVAGRGRSFALPTNRDSKCRSRHLSHTKTAVSCSLPVSSIDWKSHASTFFVTTIFTIAMGSGLFATPVTIRGHSLIT